jgi:hypothetical protein
MRAVRKMQLAIGFSILVPLAGVLFFAKLMTPLRKGTSADFWRAACGVDLNNQGFGEMMGIYPPRDGWFIYYIQGFHGQFLFYAPPSEVVSDFPKVVQKFRKSAGETNRAPIFLRAAAIVERTPSNDLSPEKFLSLLREQRLRLFRENSETLYQQEISDEIDFGKRWKTVRRFWINVLFEVVFFTGLILFAIWPWLFERARWKWSFHLGFLPLLLFLPYYAGYAAWTFTSAGPSGGALYPWVIVWFRKISFWTPIDQWMLENFPKFLEPLSQSNGPMLSISGGRPLGIVSATLIGAAIAFLASPLVERFVGRLKQKVKPSPV